MEIEFAIKGWAAWAPGLATPSHWLQWASAPRLPVGDEQPAVAQMPAMLRRRLGPLGRMAAQVAYDCQGDEGAPVVLASRYGDATRSLALLRSHALGEGCSPADFALSVHNAIGAMYSIARRDTANFSSVAAGPASAAAALVEAAGLLIEGAPEVLVVCYDAPLPGEYAAFQTEPAASYAWAWRVGPRSAGQPWLGLSWRAANDGRADAIPSLPFGLDVLRFALSADDALERRCEGARWSWSRHHG
ncbi:MAG TPA: beta-ketoacyl synthase chain length factor [Ramlibacter sp.]|nr:beta-ketoacyl synthase chain length factor [Ramlibacter sp.]